MSFQKIIFFTSQVKDNDNEQAKEIKLFDFKHVITNTRMYFKTIFPYLLIN